MTARKLAVGIAVLPLAAKLAAVADGGLVAPAGALSAKVVGASVGTAEDCAWLCDESIAALAIMVSLKKLVFISSPEVDVTTYADDVPLGSLTRQVRGST